jgi:nitrogen fixation protein NifZ
MRRSAQRFARWKIPASLRKELAAMSYPTPDPKPATISRVVHDARRRHVGRGPGAIGKHEFEPGDAVRSLTQIINDGIYPHRDIGESLVHRGDAGVVREGWSFLGESYYTVEFFTRAAVVIMRGREMARAARRGRAAITPTA